MPANNIGNFLAVNITDKPYWLFNQFDIKNRHFLKDDLKPAVLSKISHLRNAAKLCL